MEIQAKFKTRITPLAHFKCYVAVVTKLYANFTDPAIEKNIVVWYTIIKDRSGANT